MHLIVGLVRKGIVKAITADSCRHKADVEVTGPFLAWFGADRRRGPTGAQTGERS
jgi:hypothetical protein